MKHWNTYVRECLCAKLWRYKAMAEPGSDLRPMLRHVALFVPIPAILWYDSLHPNLGLRILAGAIALIAIWDWARLRKRTRKVGARQRDG